MGDYASLEYEYFYGVSMAVVPIWTADIPNLLGRYEVTRLVNQLNE